MDIDEPKFVIVAVEREAPAMRYVTGHVRPAHGVLYVFDPPLIADTEDEIEEVADFLEMASSASFVAYD